MRTLEEIRAKYMPNGAHNIRHIGGGDGKPQYKYEKKIMIEMLKEAQKEIVEHILEKAVKSTLLRKDTFILGQGSTGTAQMFNYKNGTSHYIDRESILFLKNEIIKEIENS